MNEHVEKAPVPLEMMRRYLKRALCAGLVGLEGGAQYPRHGLSMAMELSAFLHQCSFVGIGADSCEVSFSFVVGIVGRAASPFSLTSHLFGLR
ncbi:hypothetical protein [Litchfieldella rifensis]|uniref:Uncharacterized protein n=1 Tax=Litchfieldella rifensis TaxID=762643 RepID=A0ABV7LLI5_9GAMM